MGWLLRKSEEKTAAKETADNESSGSMALLLGWGAVLVATAGLWAGAEQWLKPRIAETHQNKPLVTFEAPDWMPRELTDQLKSQIDPHLSVDPYDQASLRRISEILRQSPWIGDLERVARKADNTVHIEATFRRPVALVQSKGKWHLVDAQGHRLPNYLSAADTRPAAKLLKLSRGAITGIARPAPPPGQRWEGEDLRAALKLVALIDRTDWADQVRRVDASNFRGRKNKSSAHLVIQTHRGGWVLWGRPPGSEGVYEPAADRKLANLRRIATAHDGRIDAAGAGWIVDLTQDGTWIHPAR
ncbi:MAG: hypothetical protein R3236_04500 [Phycisphaeraceae bacterium]|nr:hypothetical protein [Phycisphaeraceae bacterium]